MTLRILFAAVGIWVFVPPDQASAQGYGSRSWGGSFASARSAGYYRPRTVYPYRYYPQPYRVSYLGFPYVQRYPFSLYANGWPASGYGFGVGWSPGLAGYSSLAVGNPFGHAPLGFGYGGYPFAYGALAAEADRANFMGPPDGHFLPPWDDIAVIVNDRTVSSEESAHAGCLYW